LIGIDEMELIYRKPSTRVHKWDPPLRASKLIHKGIYVGVYMVKRDEVYGKGSEPTPGNSFLSLRGPLGFD